MSARFANGTTVLSTAYTTLFNGQNSAGYGAAGGADGSDMWGVEIWCTSGGVDVKINGVTWGQVNSTEPAHAFKFSKGTSDAIRKLEAQSVAGTASSTVYFREAQ
jgi:hypothetical protein